jgi:hypothetical protein
MQAMTADSDRPMAGRSPDRLSVERTLWEVAIKQEEHLVDELATSLIGIGALFFAYASLHGSPLQPLIALIGLGGSAVLWLHAIALNKDRSGAFTVLSERFGAPPSLRALQYVSSWRDQGIYRWIYIPMSAAATWFLGWVAFIWLWIIVGSLVTIALPGWAYAGIAVAAFGVTYADLLGTARHRRRERSRESAQPRALPARPAPSPPPSTETAR